MVGIESVTECMAKMIRKEHWNIDGDNEETGNTMASHFAKEILREIKGGWCIQKETWWWNVKILLGQKTISLNHGKIVA